MKKNSKIVLFGLLLLIVSVFVSNHFGVFNKIVTPHPLNDVKINGVYFTEPKSAHSFDLKNNKGHSFTEKDLLGHWTIMVFGFTNCSYVCPTTMIELNKMYKKLETDLSEKELPQIVFMTVDPERDTITKVDKFINSYNDKFIGVRAGLAGSKDFENQLKIKAIKVHSTGDPEDKYMVKHTAEMFVFDPSARLQAYLAFPNKANQMALDYRKIISS
ncbi:SCO family protein [Gammaproteobacteria bacterium]|nr:SCO family protein [Gammaproteobacteria bacterium]